MKYFICTLGGFILGSTSLFAQSPFLDFGAEPNLETRQEIQEWYMEKEIRNGNNPYTFNDPCG